MWGGPDDGHQISINGHAFLVHKNLFEFQKTTGQRFGDLHLCIDAICIDQDNMAEKGHEVERMSHIYHDAHEVIIWLGIDGDFGRLFAWATEDPRRRIGLDEEAENIVPTIQDLCFHPYWTPTWITQEVLMASKLRVTQASHDIGFEDLRNAIWAEIGGTEPLGQTAAARLMMTWISTAGSSPWMSIFTLLTWRADSHCADPRDRIYALLALVYLDKFRELHVDYSSDLDSLFWRAGSQFNAWTNIGYADLLRKSLRLTPLDLSRSTPPEVSIYAGDSIASKFVSWRRAKIYLQGGEIAFAFRRGMHYINRMIMIRGIAARELVCPDICIPLYSEGAYTHVNIDMSLRVWLVYYYDIFHFGSNHPRLHFSKARIWWRFYGASDGKNEWVEVKSRKSLKTVKRGPTMFKEHDICFRIDFPAAWVLERLGGPLERTDFGHARP